jgi:integrase
MTEKLSGGLNKRTVDAAAPRDRPYFLADEGKNAVVGFAVRVYPSGQKSFVFRFRPAGRQSSVTLITIGEYGTLTVQDARAQAIQLRADVTSSRNDPAKDPRAARRAVRTAKIAEANAITFGALCDAFLTDAATRVKASTAQFYREHVGSSVRKRGPRQGETIESPLRVSLGRKPAKDVTRDDVRKYYEVRRKTAPAEARRTIKMIGSVYRFGESEGLVPPGVMPTKGIVLGKLSPPRRTALSTAQYAAFGSALNAAEETGIAPAPERQRRARGESHARRAKATGNKRGPYKRAEPEIRLVKGYPVACAALRFLALTGWRIGEVRSLLWESIDDERHKATLHDTKTGVSERPLGQAARELLKAERDRQGQNSVTSAYVFPSSLDDHRPIADVGALWLNVVHKAELTLTPHGLRHSFVTVARELGYGDHVIAALVGHSLGSMTSRYGMAPRDIVREAADKVSESIAARLSGQQ